MLPNRVVYSFVVGDLFHYGHLQLLQTAKNLGDLHVCGVLTDEAAASYRSLPIANFEERSAVISCLRCVDQVVPQAALDPTHNLRSLYKTYPHAQFILVHGNNWETVPGREFIEQIGGRVVQPEYYRRLGESKIKQKVSSHQLFEFERFTEHFQVTGLKYFPREHRPFVISTKANTLGSLRPLLKHSRIEPALVFRSYDWNAKPEEVLDQVQGEFSGLLVVRSSAVNEDTFHASLAGCYDSVLNVDSTKRAQVKKAINQVVSSYKDQESEYPLHQILIQPQTQNIRVSGVVFTHQLETGAPYLTINYDEQSKRSDTVTGGREAQLLQVYRNVRPKKWSSRWQPLRKAIQEIEKVIPNVPLDIEFAITTKDKVVIFQVRPLNCELGKTTQVDQQVQTCLVRERQKLKSLVKGSQQGFGKKTLLSDMAFWNPAELIGAQPRPLALSLFQFIISNSAWNFGIVPLGYTRLLSPALLVEVAGKPYIHVRKAFEALIPALVPKTLRTRLVHRYLQVLQDSPELHDKVEFEVIDSCMHLEWGTREKQLKKWGFSEKAISLLSATLRDLTNPILNNYPDLLKKDFAQLKQLHVDPVECAEKTLTKDLRQVLAQIDEVRQCGAIPFSRMARLAFIGKTFLNSLVKRKFVSSQESEEFLDGLHSVASQFRLDRDRLAEGKVEIEEFLKIYGHLRPGTFDIRASRYDHTPELLTEISCQEVEPQSPELQKEPLISSLEKHRKIQQAMNRLGIQMDSHDILPFIKSVLEAREQAKFELSKAVSAVLESIAGVGQVLGFTREEMSFLSVVDLQKASRLSPNHVPGFLKKRIEVGRGAFETTKLILLPSIICSLQDLEFIEHPVSRPNFVTGKMVQGVIQWIGPGENVNPNLVKEKIIVIENADPGYDWIFAAGIKGLITCYGGVASHMAIRCAEFGLPAAIGCGQSYFSQLPKSGEVRLDCDARKISLVSPHSTLAPL